MSKFVWANLSLKTYSELPKEAQFTKKGHSGHLALNTVKAALSSPGTIVNKLILRMDERKELKSRGRIFSHVRPSYERAVGDLERSMNISLWV
jgi:hypothetical protein